ncbi:MAG: zinc-dependent alcohol dehydrogenase [Anaerolineae bacterium]
MRAVLWNGEAYPHGLRWAEIERPDPPPGWVLVRNRATGICGSDLHYLSGAMRHQVPDQNLPAVLGHEISGEVVAIGDGAEPWAVGDHVAAEPLHPCRTWHAQLCRACMAGRYHQCRELSFVGIPIRRLLPGGYGEYSLFHASCLFRLADHVGFDEASVLDVLACGVHAVNVGQPSPGDTVVVLGCGPIGLCALQALHAVGVRDLVAVAKYSYQAEMARTLGARAVVSLADTADPVARVRQLIGAADQVYECVGGHADTVQQAIALCRPGGKVVIEGFFTGAKPVDLEAVFLKELTLTAADGYSIAGGRREFEVALSFLESRRVNLKALITHVFPRAAWRQALDTAFNRSDSSALKVLFMD